MKQTEKKIEVTDFAQQRVFLRADLNVPLHNGTIISDFRLQSIVPTIDLIQKKGGKIILATHIDRPQKPTKELSTQVLVPWFLKQGYKISYIQDLETAHTQSFLNFNEILLLENLRFFPGEQENDSVFAKQLAALGDYYVNDAFGSIHRTDCSLYGVPKLFDPDKRMVGLLMIKELENADYLLHKAQKPFTLIVGGNKVADKLKLIEALASSIDHILLCPALAFSFLKAQGIEVGSSLVDDSSLSLCKELAAQFGHKLILPVDYKAINNQNNTLENIKIFTKRDYGICIGNETALIWDRIIQNSGTVFYNGLMGDLTKRDTLVGVQSVFNAMGQSSAYSIIGGGDSVAAAQLLHVNGSIDFMSTGGGSLIAYLANQKLPSLEILLSK